MSLLALFAEEMQRWRYSLQFKETGQMSSEIIATFITITAALIMGAVGLYIASKSRDSVKEYLENALPGLFAIEFQKWHKEFSVDFASASRVLRLEERYTALEKRLDMVLSRLPNSNTDDHKQGH
jgi:hypothetical protein